MKHITKRVIPALCLSLLGSLTINAELLWKVTAEGMEQPSYLFGTHHLAPLSIIDSIAGFDRAFQQCATIVGEIDMTGDPMQLQMQMAPYMMAPEDSTLTKVYDADTFQELDAAFKKYAPMPGISLAMLDQMKPNVVQSMVAVNMVAQSMPGFDPTQQIDTDLQLRGQKGGKVVKGLESVARQASLLFGIPIQMQAEGLKEILLNPTESMDQARKLTVAYMAQNLDALERISAQELDDPESKQFMEALLIERNEDWLTQLPGIFETPGSEMIVVGALHLPGPHGLIERLRQMGYTVTPQ